MCSDHRLSQSPSVKRWAPEARGLGASGCSTCLPNRAAHTSQAAGNRNSFLKSMRWQEQPPDMGNAALCILRVRHLSATHPRIQALCTRPERNHSQPPTSGGGGAKFTLKAAKSQPLGQQPVVFRALTPGRTCARLWAVKITAGTPTPRQKKIIIIFFEWSFTTSLTKLTTSHADAHLVYGKLRYREVKGLTPGHTARRC